MQGECNNWIRTGANILALGRPTWIDSTLVHGWLARLEIPEELATYEVFFIST
jgi:hypothetical protein